MAFVFREERKGIQARPNREVGPGTYELSPEKQSKMPKAYVPFGSMEQRSRQTKAKEITPGPGEYEVQKQNSAQRVVVSSATEDIRILEVAKPLSIFKSTTKRFNELPEGTPGPGQQYLLEDNRSYKEQSLLDRRQVKLEEPTSKPKIIEHLIKINKYQSIPSIPSNIHAYGYNENERKVVLNVGNELELNEPPVEVIKGEKEETVGPGHYNVTTSIMDRKKGHSWHNSRTIRDPPPKAVSSVGPGSYDVHNYVPVVSYKPSHAFASSTLRTMDQRKGAIANKVIADKVNNIRESRAASEKAPESTHVDSEEEDEYEFIDDSTPGPGSYLQISQTKQFKKGKNLHFGSTSRRFPQITNARNPVGPGEYDPQARQPQQPSGSFKKREAPFGSLNRRFEENNQPALIPGPGAYEPRNALEDRLIFKIQRGYRGQFGSTDERFKEPQEDKMGPGYYNPIVQVDPQAITAGSAAFKSKTSKGPSFIRKQVNPPPGAYNINYYDITKKVIKEEEEDPDLVIKKPGFNTGADRFKEEAKKEDPFEDDDIIHDIQTRAQQQLRQKKNAVPFNSKQTRLADKPSVVPGPGMYETQEDKWNKRTFNILFADI